MDKANEKEVVVAIVGAGPSGLATAACLNRLGIANIVLEREDCSASLWRKRSYDRLKLHLAKQFCELPDMPFPSNSLKFVPRDQFIEYLDNYKSGFEIKLYCQRSVESASYDDRIGKWRIVARNTGSAACLNRLGVANVVLEREDCSASLWRRRTYDRLKLHLAKQFRELPHVPFPSNSPTFVPRNQFVEYLDNYKSYFEIKPYY
ncbi:hypothetical protein NL676_027868 [Syzygium grande]|nr:hypothetical protein NL676_027868 [Syzygium grande]